MVSHYARFYECPSAKNPACCLNDIYVHVYVFHDAHLSPLADATASGDTNCGERSLPQKETCRRDGLVLILI